MMIAGVVIVSPVMENNMTQTVTLRLPLHQIREINEILSAGHEDEQSSSDAVIYCQTAKFDDGVEADIKICNGDPPYVDAVLFFDGNEVCILDASFEHIEGEYHFKYDHQMYVVVVEEE